MRMPSLSAVFNIKQNWFWSNQLIKLKTTKVIPGPMPQFRRWKIYWKFHSVFLIQNAYHFSRDHALSFFIKTEEGGCNSLWRDIDDPKVPSWPNKKPKLGARLKQWEATCMMLSCRRESNGIAPAETLIIMGQTSSLFASKTAGRGSICRHGIITNKKICTSDICDLLGTSWWWCLK